MRRFLQRLLNLFRQRRPDDDLTREIDAHLALLQEAYEARGLSPGDARRAARLALGNVDHIKETHRDARSFRWLEDAGKDAAHGVRLLRRSPIFTVTAVLSLAVGIGANTAVFSVANGLLFRPPTGITEPSRLIVIGTRRGDGGLNPVNYTAWLELSRRATTLSSTFAEGLFPHVMGLVLPEIPTAEAILGQHVTTNFFSTLGALPFRGRVFAGADDSAAVLNYDYWKRRFNGDDSVIGRTFRINGHQVTVIGVAAPGFQGTGMQSPDAWLAMVADGRRSVVVRARLRPHVPVAAAVAEVRTIGDAIDRDRAGAAVRPQRLSALPFSRVGANRNLVFGFAAALMALVSLVLAAACANVAGIMLTRATARAREMALRAALGAGRGRLVRQLLTETSVLFLFGGLLGVGLARALTRLAMLALPPLPASVVVPLATDWRVLLFALSLSFSAALVFGVLPAFRGSSVEPGAVLKDGARSSAGRARLRSAFVVGQITCSVLLVMLSASFVRVLRYAGAANQGFDPRGVEIATLDLSVIGEPGSARPVFWQAVLDRIRQMPAVESASLARVPPGGFEGIGLGGVRPGDQANATGEFAPAWNIVDTGYFTTLRIPLVAGRDFGRADTVGAPPVVIVGEGLARRFWPGQPALGKPMRLTRFNGAHPRGEQHFATVVGVAGDIRSSSLVDGLAEPYVYLPLAQSDVMGGADMTRQMSIVARHQGGERRAATMATAVQDIDRRLVFTRMASLADSIALGLTPQRVLATIGGAMALVALLLASMGIYGVTVYAVALRRREFAIRLALGAPRARVVRMVLNQGAWLVVVGLGIGLALATAIGQALSVFFYGLPAFHAPTVLGAVVLFVLIGAAAAIVPAGQAVGDGWRRALREE